MKGVIWKIEGKKSIVLFQNGDFRSIPTPPDARTGMAVTVAYNKKLLAVFAGLACAVIVAVFSILAPNFFHAGYIDIIYGRPDERRIIVELVVNRYDRILETRIFTTETAFAASLPTFDHRHLDDGYANTIMAASLYPVAPEVRVWIAHKNMRKAEEIKTRLLRLTDSLEARTGRALSLSFETELFYEP